MTPTSPRAKRPYCKPEITVVEYAAEEILAVGCKTMAGGASSRQPGPGCRISNCFQTGS